MQNIIFFNDLSVNFQNVVKDMVKNKTTLNGLTTVIYEYNGEKHVIWDVPCHKYLED